MWPQTCGPRLFSLCVENSGAEAELDVIAGFLALDRVAVPVALFQSIMHGGVLGDEDAADAAEAILDDPPTVMITSDRETGWFDRGYGTAWVMAPGAGTHGYSFR